MGKGPFEKMIDEEIARGAAPALKTGATVSRLIEQERERLELEERLAWFESDEAMEAFKTGRMMYPEVTVACLRDRLAKLGG